MLTYLSGNLFPTLETPTPGVELARGGWGSPEVLKALPPEADIPSVWLCNPVTGDLPPVVQRFILPRGNARSVVWEGKTVGVFYEDASAEWLVLMGVGPTDITASRREQTASTFANLHAALKSEGFGFHDVIRTWFYLDNILDWYDEFNRVRDTFFEHWNIFGSGFVPASTGIGSANMTGSAILAGALVMRPKAGATISRQEVESPLQCSALDYRSSFSRAAEIGLPGGRLILISGTASIEPAGATAHVEDCEKQIGLTMEVVSAILESRGMSLRDTVRAIAYIKRPEDRALWQAWLKAHDLPADFAQEIIADVCRDDLLFELELDAASSAPAP